MDKNAKFYKEVFLALKAAPESQVSYIPNEIISEIKNISEKCNEEINLKYDITGEVILSEEAKSILVVLFQKYFLQGNERIAFLQKLKENNKK